MGENRVETGLKLIKKFVIDELEGFGYFDYKDIRFEEEFGGSYYYKVIIKTIDKKEKELSFKYKPDGDKILIDVSEDCFEEIESYSYKIKYFWMSLLKWEV